VEVGKKNHRLRLDAMLLEPLKTGLKRRSPSAYPKVGGSNPPPQSFSRKANPSPTPNNSGFLCGARSAQFYVYNEILRVSWTRR
jgi:hypothetical protein